jgi:hypothetical protein
MKMARIAMLSWFCGIVEKYNDVPPKVKEDRKLLGSEDCSGHQIPLCETHIFEATSGNA